MSTVMSIKASDSPNTRTFHLFPFLPTEIRLKIWRATFPPRRRFSSGIFHISPLKLPPPPPVSLFVNHESREETQKYYDSVYYDRRFEDKQRLERFAFVSPERDILVIDGDVAFYCVQEQQRNASPLWLHKEQSPSLHMEELSTSLEIFRTMEFRNLNWPVVFINPSPGYVRQKPSIWWVITQFHGLRSIEFVMPYASLDVYCEPCKAVVEAFLDENKEMYDGGMPPRVVFIPFAEGQSLKD